MTGNEMVDGVGKLNITGNIIPDTWYRKITYSNGKPCLNAIIILSDIVYWYRPVEIRDERTGLLRGYKKKFKNDMLQRSYDDLANKFGLTKRQVKDAVDILVDMGVVIREFRNFTAGGMKLCNVTFLGISVRELEKITFEEEVVEFEEYSDDEGSVPPPTIERTTLLHSNVPSPTIERGTNTKITTENTTKITTESIDSSELPFGSSEPAADAPPLADVEPIILNTGEEWRPTEDDYQRFCRLYPNVDVKAAFRSMASWSFGNPKRRKTRNGVLKFVTTWLDKDQNNSRKQFHEQPRLSKEEQNRIAMEQLRKEIEDEERDKE